MEANVFYQKERWILVDLTSEVLTKLKQSHPTILVKIVRTENGIYEELWTEIKNLELC